MKTTPRTAMLALALLGLTAGVALAQGGKIDEVERNARHSGGSSGGGSSSGDDDCNFLCSIVQAILFHHDHDDTPAHGASHHADSSDAVEQTYGRYPWGGPRADQAFVTEGPGYRPAFGVTTVSWFKDASSTLGGISLDAEGGFDVGRLALNFTAYREPKRNETDHLYSLRGELGGVGAMGRGFFTGGLGGRLICLDNGTCAGGADLAVGARVLPLKPLILSGNARLGGAKWFHGGWFWVTETNASASFMIGRVELGGGWHWLKLGNAAAFAGPLVVARVWF